MVVELVGQGRYANREGMFGQGVVAVVVEFGLLGEVEARVDGRLIDLGHARQRCVLVALLVDANHVVSVDQLVDRVWGEHLPHRVRSTLSSYLSRLRQALAPADEVDLVRRSGGYVLTVNPDAVDAHRFHRLVTQARAVDEDEERALVLFEQALALWRGESLAGLDTPWLSTVREGLERQRWAAELDHVDLALGLGRHGGLLAELAARAAAHPLDERVAGQLMLALYRGGRPAEALEHYQQVRRHLAEELGTDPSSPLQELHQQILTADPILTTPTTTRSAPASAPSPVPRQLPARAPYFVGRGKELRQLTALLDTAAEEGGTVVISAIGGTGGIGKTWLALHWAHENVERFPDGQLWVNLRGFDPAGEPMAPVVAVRGFLDALGVDPQSVPVDPDAQVGLYRSLVAGKRMLIVVDNARDTSQVESLLPGSSSCTVLVTSRHQLGGLVTAHGARPLALDVLNEHEAHELLSRRLGADRLAGEPEAVAELLGCCVGLPLALSIVAARAALHPDLPLAVLAGELREASSRLGALDAGDLRASLAAVFSWSYTALDPWVAEVFGLLGLASGPDISLGAAASLTAQSISRVAVLLRELERVSLVQQHVPGRYRMHDLVRLYAADRAKHDHPREAALRRLVDCYLHTAYTGERLLDPHRRSIELGPPAPGCLPYPLRDEKSALTWFDTDHPCLLATQRLAAEQGWHTPVWQLAWTLDGFHWRRGHLHDHLTVWRAGLAAADQLGEPATHALAHRFLGHACSRASRHAEALEHLGQALTLAEQTGDAFGQASTYYALAWVWEQQGDDQQALTHASQALRLYQTLDTPVWEADALNAVGWCHARLGHHQQAQACCEHALALFRQHHNPEGEAATLDSLGYLAHHSGQHTQALGYYHQALTLYHDRGNTYQEADTLARLGEARAAWQQALELYQAQHRTTDADRVQQHLAALDHNSG